MEGQYTSFDRITWTKVISNMRISGQIDQYSIYQISWSIRRRIEPTSGVSPRQPLLGPASDSGLHLAAHGVSGDQPIVLVAMRQSMGTRPDERHVATQHVEELRQLVDAQLAHQSSKPGHAQAIPLGLPNNRPIVHRRHRTKLENSEPTPVKADPRLHEERRSRRLEPDGEGHHAEQRKQEKQASRRDALIERLFQVCVGSGQAERVEFRLPSSDPVRRAAVLEVD